MNMAMGPMGRLILIGFAAFAAVGFVPRYAFAGDLVIHPVVMRELNQVVRAADGLHKALVKEEDEQLEIAVRDVIRSIDRVRTVLILAKHHERPHLLKIVTSARDALELSLSTYGEERQERFRLVYQQIVNIVRIYKVDTTYGIFFCDKDKSSWVQKGKKGQNPISPSQRSCGLRVPN